jgi:wobble nucleotide-excising tRNase
MKWGLGIRGDLLFSYSGKGTRKYKAVQIKKMLLEESLEDNIPNYILSDGLRIIFSERKDLSEKDINYDNLLNEYYNNRIDANDLKNRWDSLKENDEIASSEIVKDKSGILEVNLIKKINKFPLPYAQCADDDVLFQVSTIDALLQGVLDGFFTFEDLKTHGDFGIGTFDSLDGEMIALDGD